MYLDLGQTTVIPHKEVIGIFDLDNTSYSKHTRAFLRQAEENGQVAAATDDLPKSFLLTQEFGMDRIYLTQFSPATLEKRLKEAKI